MQEGWHNLSSIELTRQTFRDPHNHSKLLEEVYWKKHGGCNPPETYQVGNLKLGETNTAHLCKVTMTSFCHPMNFLWFSFPIQGWKQQNTTWDVNKTVNNGINYQTSNGDRRMCSINSMTHDWLNYHSTTPTPRPSLKQCWYDRSLLPRCRQARRCSLGEMRYVTLMVLVLKPRSSEEPNRNESKYNMRLEITPSKTNMSPKKGILFQ